MQRLSFALPSNSDQWLCPNLTDDWQLGKQPGSNDVVLFAPKAGYQVRFLAMEGFALRYFVGRFTVAQVQAELDCEFGEENARDVVTMLVQKLIALGLIEISAADRQSSTSVQQLQLKACVEWIHHPDDYWILRNPEDLTFLQIDPTTKAIIERFGQSSLSQIAQQYQLEPAELQHLVQLLKATSMLAGSQVSPPPKTGLNPLKLLNFKLRLCNPDQWLTQHIQSLNWIWSRPGAIALIALLTVALVLGLHQRGDLWLTGKQLLEHLSPSLILSFLLLSALVVTLHELAHAFTLKHYGGSVPEIGLMMMLLMPIAYTNTTDQYRLQRRRARSLVVGAGVLCQLMIAAIALIVWIISASGSWLWLTAYLLMTASLFTVAINLNPLVKFDGYYLLVALSGINNLRQRSVQFYKDSLSLQPSLEKPSNRFLLALYAPFSLLYSVIVFGSLLLWLGDWILSHIPLTALTILIAWGIHRFNVSRISQSST